jgi:hypothetical protein
MPPCALDAYQDAELVGGDPMRNLPRLSFVNSSAARYGALPSTRYGPRLPREQLARAFELCGCRIASLGREVAPEIESCVDPWRWSQQSSIPEFSKNSRRWLDHVRV